MEPFLFSMIGIASTAEIETVNNSPVVNGLKETLEFALSNIKNFIGLAIHFL